MGSATDQAKIGIDIIVLDIWVKDILQFYISTPSCCLQWAAVHHSQLIIGRVSPLGHGIYGEIDVNMDTQQGRHHRAKKFVSHLRGFGQAFSGDKKDCGGA